MTDNVRYEQSWLLFKFLFSQHYSCWSWLVFAGLLLTQKNTQIKINLRGNKPQTYRYIPNDWEFSIVSILLILFFCWNCSLCIWVVINNRQYNFTVHIKAMLRTQISVFDKIETNPLLGQFIFNLGDSSTFEYIKALGPDKKTVLSLFYKTTAPDWSALKHATDLN